MLKKKSMPTREEVGEWLSYDPETGVLTRIKSSCPRTQIGDVAGCKKPQGYILVSVMGRVFQAHRLAYLLMTGSAPSLDIDHVNMDRADNRWVNLRLATRSQNRRNVKSTVGSSSKFLGVYRSGKTGWRAELKDHGERHDLGAFDSEEAAAKAYDLAAAKYHGVFANPNFPQEHNR